MLCHCQPGWHAASWCTCCAAVGRGGLPVGVWPSHQAVRGRVSRWLRHALCWCMPFNLVDLAEAVHGLLRSACATCACKPFMHAFMPVHGTGTRALSCWTAPRWGPALGDMHQPGPMCAPQGAARPGAAPPQRAVAAGGMEPGMGDGARGGGGGAGAHRRLGAVRRLLHAGDAAAGAAPHGWVGAGREEGTWAALHGLQAEQLRPNGWRLAVRVSSVYILFGTCLAASNPVLPLPCRARTVW